MRRSLWAPLRSGDRCGVAARWAAGARRSALTEHGPPARHFHPRLLLVPDTAPARCVLAVSVVRTWKLRHSAIERLTPAHTAEEGETQTQAGGLQGPSCPRSDGWCPQQAPGLSQGDRAAPEQRGDGSGGTQAAPEKPPRGQPRQSTGPSERAAPSPPGPRPPRPAVQRMGGEGRRRKTGGLSHPPDSCGRLPSPSPGMLTPRRNQGSFMASPSTSTVPQEPRTGAT